MVVVTSKSVPGTTKNSDKLVLINLSPLTSVLELTVDMVTDEAVMKL